MVEFASTMHGYQVLFRFARTLFFLLFVVFFFSISISFAFVKWDENSFRFLANIRCVVDNIAVFFDFVCPCCKICWLFALLNFVLVHFSSGQFLLFFPILFRFFFLSSISAICSVSVIFPSCSLWLLLLVFFRWIVNCYYIYENEEMRVYVKHGRCTQRHVFYILYAHPHRIPDTFTTISSNTKFFLSFQAAFFFHFSFLAFNDLDGTHWRQMINQIRDADEQIKRKKKMYWEPNRIYICVITVRQIWDLCSIIPLFVSFIFFRRIFVASFLLSITFSGLSFYRPFDYGRSVIFGRKKRTKLVCVWYRQKK